MSKSSTPHDDAKTQPVVKRSLPKASQDAPASPAGGSASGGSAAAGKGPGSAPAPKPVAAGTAPAGAAPAPRPAAPQTGPQPASRPLPANPNAQTQEAVPEDQGPSTFGMWLRTTPSWLTSTVLHLIVLLILAIYTIKGPEKPKYQFVASTAEKSEEVISEVPDEVSDIKSEIVNPEALMDVVTSDTVQEMPEIKDVDAGKMKVDLQEFGDPTNLRDNLLNSGKGVQGDGIGARSDGKAKAAAIAGGGGSPESEKAVAWALEWLARHQLPDGGWSFDHRLANHPNGRNPGSLKDARVAASGLALMAFLGAGHTHKQGKHKKVVERGLYFLTSRVKPNGSLHEPGSVMYGHGIASIALCEAYAMTQDKSLKNYAQASINFIVAAQDRVGGGWRYEPGQPGDTSVVGWQLMALKSAHMAYLAVPPQTIAGVNNFLNIVQSDSGSKYGYTGPGGGAATTAIGLLCRMYLGWKKENGALDRGTEFLDQVGPSQNEMYYNYYATQVMHHWEGERWKKWNEVMRERLINTQEKQGTDEAGSWYFNGGHGAAVGGRLYNTCMCAMTLEVYYRHSPIYRKQSTEDEFDQ